MATLLGGSRWNNDEETFMTYENEQNLTDVTGYDCEHPSDNNSLKEEHKNELHMEIKTDCFGDAELAKKRGWYRKFFYCPNCNLLIKTETWNEKYMFGSGTVLKTNEMPNYCPDCGTKLNGGNLND